MKRVIEGTRGPIAVLSYVAASRRGAPDFDCATEPQAAEKGYDFDAYYEGVVAHALANNAEEVTVSFSYRKPKERTSVLEDRIKELEEEREMFLHSQNNLRVEVFLEKMKGLAVATLAWDTSHAYCVGDLLVRHRDRVMPERAYPLGRIVGKVIEPLPSAQSNVLYFEVE